MGKVSLISVSKPLIGDLKTAEDLIVYCARVSSPKNQDNLDTGARLLAYCIRQKHWSIFEQASMTVEIVTTRAISAQILRHKSFFAQEFCMSGDTLVYFDMPSAIKKKKKALYKISLKELYRKWNSSDALGHPLKDRIIPMNVRSYDLETKLMKHSHIKEVFQTGVKDIFEISLCNGKKIKCTKEHKVLTQSGFVSLEDGFGLTLNGNTASISKNDFIGCNGIPVYQDYEWLSSAKKKCIKNKTGVHGIADMAGVSYHTIRKWLKVLDLRFTKKETASMFTVWNKGRSGYNTQPRTRAQRDYMKSITPTGKDHHAYKGGGNADRKAINNYFKRHRSDIFKKFNYNCQMCHKPFTEKLGRIDLHHIKPVCTHPELARDLNNVIPVHVSCHMEHHGRLYVEKIMNRKLPGPQLTACWSKIESVKYIGKEMTYDLEIDDDSHNYVADGVIVHNSQRYSETNAFEYVKARRQDVKNRQNSIDDMSDDDSDWFDSAQTRVMALAEDVYKEALSRNIAKEQARFLLPMSAQTRLYLTGSVRSFIHYLQVRTDASTQKEHRDIAFAIRDIFCEQFPAISEALEWK